MTACIEVIYQYYLCWHKTTLDILTKTITPTVYSEKTRLKKLIIFMKKSHETMVFSRRRRQI